MVDHLARPSAVDRRLGHPEVWVPRDQPQLLRQKAAEILGDPDDPLRLVVCHLGNGCSASAIRGDKPVDTSMSFTPLDGLMMGTRSGSVDPGVLLYLLKEGRIDRDGLDDALNHHSGLIGVSGVDSDYQKVEQAADSGNDQATLALEIYSARVRATIGAMAATLGGIDALVFAAGSARTARRSARRSARGWNLWASSLIPCSTTPGWSTPTSLPPSRWPEHPGDSHRGGTHDRSRGRADRRLRFPCLTTAGTTWRSWARGPRACVRRFARPNWADPSSCSKRIGDRGQDPHVGRDPVQPDQRPRVARSPGDLRPHRPGLRSQPGPRGAEHSAGVSAPGGKFLGPSLRALSCERSVELFELEGVRTKVEGNGKVFPLSDKAVDVVNALVARLNRTNAEVRLNSGVTEVRSHR